MLVPMLSLCALSTLCDICLPFSQVFLQSGRLHPYLCHVADLSYPCSAEQGCLSAFICLWCTTWDTWSLWLGQKSFAPGYLGQPIMCLGWQDVSKPAYHTCHDWNSRVGKLFDARWYSCTKSSMCHKSSITYNAPSTAFINKTIQFRFKIEALN